MPFTPEQETALAAFADGLIAQQQADADAQTLQADVNALAQQMQSEIDAAKTVQTIVDETTGNEQTIETIDPDTHAAIVSKFEQQKGVLIKQRSGSVISGGGKI